MFHRTEFKQHGKGLMAVPLIIDPVEYLYTLCAFLESVDMCLLADWRRVSVESPLITYASS
jgi:hypothetical protein